jgi:hypothetical protein
MLGLGKVDAREMALWQCMVCVLGVFFVWILLRMVVVLKDGGCEERERQKTVNYVKVSLKEKKVV